jgi:hypothetical protein
VSVAAGEDDEASVATGSDDGAVAASASVAPFAVGLCVSTPASTPLVTTDPEAICSGTASVTFDTGAVLGLLRDGDARVRKAVRYALVRPSFFQQRLDAIP